MQFRHLRGAQLVVALVGAAGATHTISAQTAQPLYKFSLDYDVPESPGFATLGVSPNNVLRGNAAKPVVTTLLNQIAAGGHVRSGVAIDVAPYFVYGGRLTSVDDYADHLVKRALANTQLSFATIQNPADTASVSFALGARITLLDAHDLLANKALLAPIFKTLNDCATALSPNQLKELDGAPVTSRECKGLDSAFARAKQAAVNQRGWSLALGAGAGGLLKNSVASRDSLGERRGRVWLGGGYMFSRGQELLFTAQAQDSVTQGWSFRGGGAARANFPSAQFALEIVYDGASRAFLPGGSAEWRVLPGIWLVGSLTGEGIEASGQHGAKLRVRTALRWNAAGSGI